MRRLLGPRGRYLVSATALCALVYYLGLANVLESFRHVQTEWLLVLLVLIAMTPAFFAVQVWGALRILRRPVGAPELMTASLNAWAFGALTPARTGDLSLAYFLGEDVPRSELVAVVILDKALSLAVLALGAVVSVYAISLPRLDVVVTASLLIILGLLIVGLATRFPVVMSWVVKVTDRLTGPLPGESLRRLGRLAQDPVLFTWSLGVVLCRWTHVCLASLVGFRAFGQHPDLLHVIAAVTVGRIVALVPVSIGGMGLKEPLQVAIYSRQDVPGGTVVALSLIGVASLLTIAALIPLLFPSRQKGRE